MPTPADIAISDLPAAGTITSANLLPLVQAGTTVKGQVTSLITGLPVATGSSVGVMSATDKTKLDAATSSDTVSTLVQRDSSGNFSAGTITATRITGLATPSVSSDAANKGYVDAAAQGLDVHAAVRVATTGSNINLNAAPTTLDGVSLATDDRILVKNQTVGHENGIYRVNTLGSGSNGVWQRTSDADTSDELATGTYVFVTSGTLNANTSWVMNTPPPITLNTTSLTWVLYSSLTTIPASSITGQIVASQIANSAITTAKFAAGITPVEIVATLPTSDNFEGRQAFLTTDKKLYRYTGSAWTTAVATVDLTGQIANAQIVDAAIDAVKIATSAITTTKIADDAISTPKIVAGAVKAAQIDALAVTAGKIAANAVTASTIAAGSVEAGKIAASAVTAGTIAANAVTAGTIAAAAVNTAELAAGAITTAKIYAGAVDTNALAANAVTAGKIEAGAVTADKINVTNLAAINANLGTITAGSLTASSSVTVGAGISAISISSAGFTIGGGRITGVGDGTNPTLRAYGTGAYAGTYAGLNANISVPAFLEAVNGTDSVVMTGTGVVLANAAKFYVGSSGDIRKTTLDSYTPALYDGTHTLEFRWSDTFNLLYLRVNGGGGIPIGPA